VPRRLAVLAALALLALSPSAAHGARAIEAAAYIVVNPATGETLSQRLPDRELPMASTTKIMTALLVLETADLDEVLTVPQSAAVGGSTGRLEPGERLAVRDLLTALLVASGNDAAVTLAEGLAGSQAAFVDRMNARARELRLSATRFANPHGLDEPGHHSSVRDLVRLAAVAMRDPFFRRAVDARVARIPGPGGVGVRRYESENALLDIDPEIDGVKTGMTDDAGFALVAHARRQSLGVELYAALIGSPSAEERTRDGRELLERGFSRYARATLVGEGAVYGHAAVEGRPGTSVPYRVAAALQAPLRIGGGPVTEVVTAQRTVAAPVAAGQVLGSVTLRQAGRVLGRRDLVAARAAGGPTIWDRIRSGLGAVLP
jgi:D-alanyl-D-alanine carboxypeptidase (penicillin-binding protein 5/6)